MARPYPPAASHPTDRLTGDSDEIRVLRTHIREREGPAEEGLHVVDEALALVDRYGVRYYEAELYRLKGVLLQRLPVPEVRDVESCLAQALDIARRQRAKSWELRATLSLVRLWQRQGKIAEAHTLLADVFGRFTEGFDTADLQEAMALLEALS